jgi:hypothetical protein
MRIHATSDLDPQRKGLQRNGGEFVHEKKVHNLARIFLFLAGG